jgi:hypothetical protein
LNTQRYSTCSFHHDGDFTGSVLVTANSLDYIDASPSSSEPSEVRGTVITMFAALGRVARDTVEDREYIELVGPNGEEHSRFDVCDVSHAEVLPGEWRQCRVGIKRCELVEFLRLGFAYRAARRVERLVEQLMPSQLQGESNAQAFFGKLAALGEEFDALPISGTARYSPAH